MFKLTFISLLILQVTLADKLKVDVYFEALCPDSKDFVVNQLFPLYNDAEFKDRLNINLIPFGKASFKEIDGTLQFTCQHGPNECLANTYLACSLNMNTFDQTMNYTQCIMSSQMPQNNLEECAKKLSLNYDNLKSCQEDKTKGPLYLKEQGNKTFALKPKLIFVPTVVINDKHERREIPSILSNFKNVICSRLVDKPKSC